MCAYMAGVFLKTNVVYRGGGGEKASVTDRDKWVVVVGGLLKKSIYSVTYFMDSP